MNFKPKRRLLTETEKYRRAIFYYTFDKEDFEPLFEDEAFDQYGQPQVKIEENLKLLDEDIKNKVFEYVQREIYDETVDFKCLKCFYEENDIDFEEICESWDGVDYPKMYCPKCGKPHFVPLEIFNQKNKYRK